MTRGEAVKRLQTMRVVRWWCRNNARYGNWWRLANGVAAAVLLFAAVQPVIQIAITSKAYALSSSTNQLIGPANATLAGQLSYNATSGTYEFNQSSINTGSTDNPASLLNKTGSTGTSPANKSTYALSIPQTFSKGVTYTDSNSGLSFTMRPQFDGLDAKEEDNHLVFPLSSGEQAIYTLKDNGLKEDIIIPKLHQNSLSFSYTVALPDTLAMRVIPGSGGEIGVYSASPALYGNIQYAAASDRAAVDKARANSPKDYLVFGLPAPVVKTLQGDVVGRSHFVLKGNTLTVEVNNLPAVHDPVTLDPSVVVNSATSFQTDGNNEGMISFNTAGQVTRDGLTGGDIGPWTSTTSFTTTGRENQGTVAYNGYLYMAGGNNRSTGMTRDVEYAPINSDGTVGGWTATTALPAPYYQTQLVTYNGYMYLVGGQGQQGGAGDSVDLATTYVAPINSNGSLGGWVQTASLPVSIANAGVVTYQGYLYVLGGSGAGYNDGNCGAADACLNTTYDAPLNADGTIGSWATSTALPVATAGAGAVAYNGSLYVMGGALNGGGIGSGVYQASINGDGSIGSWNTLTSFTGNHFGMAAYGYDGYLYLTGGFHNNADTQYAPIYANGSIGSWTTSTTTLAVGIEYPSYAAYNGCLYLLGGYNSSVHTDYNTVQYARIDPAGTTTAYKTSANTYTAARFGGQTVVSNGYIYELGGSNMVSGGTMVNTVYMARLSSNGSIGTWTATTGLPETLQLFSATAYNGYLYVVGGCTSLWSSCTTASNDAATVYMAAISSDGTLGPWATETSLPTGLYGLSAVAYGGTLYVMGGINASTFQKTVYYQSFGSNGILAGSWITSTKTLSAANAYFGAVAYGGWLYVAGGCTAGVITCTATTNAVQSAQLTNTTGTAGDLAASFTTTGNSSFTNARGMFGMVVLNGYLYIMGGCNNTTNYSDTQYAPITSNGSVGAWATDANGTLSSARYGIGAATSNGFLYVTGGTDGTNDDGDTQYAQVNNGGDGTVGSWAASSNSFASARMGLASVAANGYLYILGGCTNGNPGSCNATLENDVQYAPITGDGSLGTWQTASNTFTTPRYGLSAVTYDGYIYILGGDDGRSDLNDVQYAPLNTSTGAPGTWTTTSSFTTGRSFLAAVASNGYLYVMGGKASGAYLNDVQYAPINSNGSLGNWSTNSTSFSVGRYGLSGTAYNGYLYVLGGCSAGTCSTTQNDVQYAPINSNGTVGAWTATNSFTTARDVASVAAYDGYMYIMGGYAGQGQVLGDVQAAPINSNGSIGSWNELTALPNAEEAGTSAVANGYLYINGGYGSNSVYSTTYYAPLNTIARVGHYSKLIDLGAGTTVTGITYNGTIPGGNTAMTYRTAGSNGVFGPSASINTLSDTGGCSSSGTAGVQYVWVDVTLDDSGTGAFPDTASSPANLSTLVVSYAGHLTPQTRLRGGQTLQNGVLSPLDTCGA